MFVDFDLGLHFHTDLSPLHCHLSVTSDSPVFFLPALSLGSPFLLLTWPLFSLLGSVFPTLCTFFLFGLLFVAFGPSLQLQVAQSCLSIMEM